MEAVDLAGVVGEERVQDAVRFRVRRRAENGDDERGRGENDWKPSTHVPIASSTRTATARITGIDARPSRFRGRM